MSDKRLCIADYPLSETQPETVTGARGKRLDEITLDKVISGDVDMEDLRVTAEALRRQAEIADAAGRPTLAQNFRRGAELTGVPQEVIMEVYELLRPGRARKRADLEAAANRLRQEFGAERMAAFVEEAAEVYDRRGLFTFRY